MFLYKMDLQSYNVTSLESFGANSHSLNGVFTIMGNENTLPFIYIVRPTQTYNAATNGKPCILKYNVNTNEFTPREMRMATVILHFIFQDSLMIPMAKILTDIWLDME